MVGAVEVYEDALETWKFMFTRGQRLPSSSDSGDTWSGNIEFPVCWDDIVDFVCKESD